MTSSSRLFQQRSPPSHLRAQQLLAVWSLPLVGDFGGPTTIVVRASWHNRWTLCLSVFMRKQRVQREQRGVWKFHKAGFLQSERSLNWDSLSVNCTLLIYVAIKLLRLLYFIGVNWFSWMKYHLNRKMYALFLQDPTLTRFEDENKVYFNSFDDYRCSLRYCLSRAIYAAGDPLKRYW